MGRGNEMKTNYVSSRPSQWYAAKYREDELHGGHVVMLSRDEETKHSALEALREFPGGLQIGGGIDPSNCEEFLDAGASHVIVTSYVFRNGRVDERALQEMQIAAGKDRLVLDLSCRRSSDGTPYIVTDRWQKFTDVALDEEALLQLGQEASELLVHGVDYEGLGLGIDEGLVALLGAHSPVPVTYAGGARSIQDLDTIREAGGGEVDVTVGSALDIFGGHLKYDDVISWHKAKAEGVA